MHIAKAVILSSALVFLAGCSRTDYRSETDKSTVSISKTTRQILAPDGQIVELTDVTQTTTDESTGEIRHSRTTLEAPKVVGSLGQIAGALAGPATGKLVETGVDWLTTLLAGGGAAITAGGAGWVALRKTQRQRDEVIDGFEAVTEDMSDEEWSHKRKLIKASYSDDTRDAVRKRVG